MGDGFQGRAPRPSPTGWAPTQNRPWLVCKISRGWRTNPALRVPRSPVGAPPSHGWWPLHERASRDRLQARCGSGNRPIGLPGAAAGNAPMPLALAINFQDQLVPRRIKVNRHTHHQTDIDVKGAAALQCTGNVQHGHRVSNVGAPQLGLCSGRHGFQDFNSVCSSPLPINLLRSSAPPTNTPRTNTMGKVGQPVHIFRALRKRHWEK